MSALVTPCSVAPLALPGPHGDFNVPNVSAGAVVVVGATVVLGAAAEVAPPDADALEATVVATAVADVALEVPRPPPHAATARARNGTAHRASADRRRVVDVVTACLPLLRPPRRD
jgi:hypothetical protein